MIYSVDEDQMVPVTQTMVDRMQKQLLKFAALRASIHGLTEPGALAGDD